MLRRALVTVGVLGSFLLGPSIDVATEPPEQPSAPAAAAKGKRDGDLPESKDDARSGDKPLEGKWSVWRQETADGVEAPAPGTTFMVVEGNKIAWLWGGNNVGTTARFTLSTDVDPKEIDIVITSADFANLKQLGIYRMTKDGQLQICLSEISKTPKRPRKFTAHITPGSGWTYLTYRKEDFKEPPEVVKEKKKLEGRWIVPGQPGDPVLIDEDVMTFYYRDTQVGRVGRFAIDPSKNPKEIELVYTQGYPGKRVIGIYRIQGNKLEIAFSGMDSDKRPTKFADNKTPGGGDQYYNLELQEK